MKPAPWSFSSLDTFANCPRQYRHKYVLKDVPKDTSPEIVWGNYVHKAFEDRQATNVVLPADLQEHEKFMEHLDKLKDGIFYDTERKISLDINGKPVNEFFGDHIWWRGVIDWRCINEPEKRATLVDYKGLPLDTLISTPAGFTTMQDVQVGDLVHGSDGLAYPVLVKSPVHRRPCFEVEFDDKTKVVCDNVHLWSLIDGSVVPVTELVARKSCIPVAAPVEMPEQRLPIDPYVLGLWLADGKHTSAEISKPDPEVWAEIERRGYVLGADTGATCPTRTVLGIRGALTVLGVRGDKHIPAIYLRGSIQQRVELLRGLMDGDGSVNTPRKQVVFQNTNRRLSDNVLELVNSLGCRASQARTHYSGFGVCGIAYPVSWRPRHFNPFLLPRKASKAGPWGEGRSWFRRVVRVTPVEDRETQCIGVGSPDRTYLCTRARLVTHNTGKPHDKWKQLGMFAIHTFLQFPTVDLVNAQFYWTKTATATKKVWSREDVPHLWSMFLPDLKQYAQAFKTDTWQERPSGLCNGWCSVTQCPHWRPKRVK